MEVKETITKETGEQGKLRQAQRMEALGTLAGGIAHNFNNLLAVISMAANLMEREVNAEHTLHKYLQMIEIEVKKGEKLTSSLLAYARQGKYNPMQFDLNQMVQSIVGTFAEINLNKAVEIECQFSDKLAIVNVDMGQFEQVLLNLLLNSADAISGKGLITVSTAKVAEAEMAAKIAESVSGDYIRLQVADNGAGMDEETQKRVFEPFFTTKEVGKGTGLGLSCVYGIVRSHGGFIDFQSAKGAGAIFSIYLPACSEKQTGEKKEKAESRNMKMKILLADDEKNIRELLKEAMRAKGYEIIIAENGAEAIKKYKEHHRDIDLAILDMAMPEINGDIAFARMREINPGIKAILISGYSKDDTIEQSLAAGFSGFLQKPFKIDVLLQMISKILSC